MIKRVQRSRLNRSRGFVAADFAGQVLHKLVARPQTSSPIKKVVVPTVPQRQAELAEFNEVYENLVDAICDAAHYGASAKAEMAYAASRATVQALYPSVKPFLISYLEMLPEDAEIGLKLSGGRLDTFEALVAPADLEQFIALDDGNMISRLTRTRQAIDRYCEHLSLLSQRAA